MDSETGVETGHCDGVTVDLIPNGGGKPLVYVV